MDFHSQRILPDRPECRANASETTIAAQRHPHGRRQLGPCHRPFFRHIITRIGFIIVIGLLAWKLFYQKERRAAPPPAIRQKESIPPGIVVTESSSVVPPPPTADGAPGDRLLGGYGDPNQPPRDDVVAMARAISSFLLIDKQAASRPLSANEEWSAALRGLRPGTEPWISDRPPVFDPQHRLIDRWGTPLIFHALGGRQWEVRSAGPDRKPWNDDDLVEKFYG